MSENHFLLNYLAVDIYTICGGIPEPAKQAAVARSLKAPSIARLAIRLRVSNSHT
jgi:hypothetical protein